MNQTNEAEQRAAVPDDDRVFLTIVYQVPRKHADGFLEECTSSAHFSAASWSHALDDRDQARAALKAQPAPAEALQHLVDQAQGLDMGYGKGEDGARVDEVST